MLEFVIMIVFYKLFKIYIYSNILSLKKGILKKNQKKSKNNMFFKENKFCYEVVKFNCLKAFVYKEI